MKDPLSRVMADQLKSCGPRELLLWVLRRRWRFRVTGDSMSPALVPGQEVLADPRAYRARLPVPGDIIVVRHPYRTDLRLIKRVSHVDEDGLCFLEGDNPTESTDSRSFGSVGEENILGRVTSRFF